HEWGPALARMPATMPAQRPNGRNDFDTLRWSVRSDGQSGFVFVNNYQRSHEMPARENTQFSVNLPGGSLTFPSNPVTAPANECFIWPFNLDLGHGVVLNWATVQPVCAIEEGTTRTVFFGVTKEVPAQFAFKKGGIIVQAASGQVCADGE